MVAHIREAALRHSGRLVVAVPSCTRYSDRRSVRKERVGGQDRRRLAVSPSSGGKRVVVGLYVFFVERASSLRARNHSVSAFLGNYFCLMFHIPPPKNRSAIAKRAATTPYRVAMPACVVI